jgi:hypothetical protein
MSHFLFLLSLIAALGGCVAMSSGSDAAPGEKTSTVILHTSLHESNCLGINMVLAQRDASGRWVQGKSIILKEMFDSQQTPSQIELPAGAYGISHLGCVARRQAFSSHIVDKPTMFDRNRPIIIDKPFATFKVLPGEVVDIGSLRMPHGVARQSDGTAARRSDWSIKHVFIGAVTPTPEVGLRSLAEKNPELYRRRVVRPMVSTTNN